MVFKFIPNSSNSYSHEMQKKEQGKSNEKKKET